MRPALAAAFMLALAGAAVSAGTLDPASESREETLVVGEAPHITMTHVAGSIRVRGQRGSNLTVHIVKRGAGGGGASDLAALENVNVTVRGGIGRAEIGVSYRGLSNWETLKALARKGALERVAVDYDVVMPRMASLEISTVSGEVSLAMVEGGVSVNSVSSPMVLEKVAGGCRVATISGDLTVAGIAGGLAVQTVSGMVKGRVVRGSCVIDTVSGPIDLAVEPQASGIAKITSISGPVALWLSERSPVNLDLKTSSGSVVSEVPGASPQDGRTLQTQLGGGGSDVNVRTVTGAITLRRRK